MDLIMNEQNYLTMLQESSLRQEGKTWDKVKKVWRDHKGKIIAGTALAAAAGAGIAAYTDKKNKEQKKYGIENDKLNAERRAKEKAEAEADDAKTKARHDAEKAASDKKYKDYADTERRAEKLKQKSGKEKYYTGPEMGKYGDNDKVEAGQKIIKQIAKDNDDRYTKLVQQRTKDELAKIRNQKSNKVPTKFVNNTPDKGKPEPGLSGKKPNIKESLTDLYLNHVQEGKTWDKVKKVWRDHKGKIIAGTTLAAIAAGGKLGADAIAKRKKDIQANNAEKQVERKKMKKALKSADAMLQYDKAEKEAEARNKANRMTMA
jgi:hypothetical protein